VKRFSGEVLVIKINTCTQEHRTFEKGVKRERKRERKEKKRKFHIRKNIYYTEVVISQFSSKKANVTLSFSRFQCAYH
jgi:hypothetical protein